VCRLIHPCLSGFNTARLDPMDDTVKRRRYVSPLRADQARRTRDRVVAAAHELFLRDGYAATPVTAIAAQAGVAADTVYATFGTKRSVLKAVMDANVGGDGAPVKLLDREAPQRMRAETDQRRQVALLAAGISRQLERARPLDDVLRAAAGVEPEVAALREDQQLRQRREAMDTVARWIRARGPLRGGMPAKAAGAVLWTLTSSEVHHMLRESCGWSAPRYERWLRDTLLRTLLPDRLPSAGGTSARAPTPAG